MKTRKRSRRVFPLAAAAAVLAFGTTVCAAGYLKWSRGLQGEFSPTEEQRQMLQAEQIVTPAAPENNSVTSEGVTITAEQTIVTKEFAWLSFRVDGYDLEEGKEPCFEGVNVIINGSDSVSHSSYFYNGLQQDENGQWVYEDGSEMEETADGRTIERYAAEDGSLEYVIWITSVGDDSITLTDSTAKIQFSNLGTVYKAEYTPDLDAEWELDIAMKGSDAVREVSLSEPLGDSGAVVKHAEISPISIQVDYDFAAQKIVIDGVNENGESIQSTDYAEPPMINGVRLKDGTLLTAVTNGGKTQWDEEMSTYTVTFATNRILDTAQIDALLFLKAIPDQPGPIAEENLYVVPIE